MAGDISRELTSLSDGEDGRGWFELRIFHDKGNGVDNIDEACGLS